MAATLREDQGGAVSDNDRPVVPPSHGACQLRMLHEVTILSMHRYEVFRFDQIQYRLQLVLAGMPGDMDLTGGLVMNFRTTPVQVVDQMGDSTLVPGDELG